MERIDATSELQSRLSSLSFSGFSGITSRQFSVEAGCFIFLIKHNHILCIYSCGLLYSLQTSEHRPFTEFEPRPTQMPPLDPPTTWTSAALKELKSKLRGEKDSVVTVYRGDIMTVHVPTVPEAKKVCWEFATDGYDIGFGIYFDWSPVTSRSITVHISESSDDEDEEEELEGPVMNGDVEKGSKSQANSNLAEILPVYRQDSHLSVHGGSHDFPGEGTYLLKFDNSYSLWRNKTLYYRVYYSA
uniref:GOLD domain-containing protein n=1 Tax=Periophthalmus magnuspinnatus TaxID=409849 RepID=A0A3B4ABQ2_9GOBI